MALIYIFSEKIKTNKFYLKTKIKRQNPYYTLSKNYFICDAVFNTRNLQKFNKLVFLSLLKLPAFILIEKTTLLFLSLCF